MFKHLVKLIVFDMAGTTVSDKNEVEKCFVEAAKTTQLKFDVEEIVSMMGWSKRLVFEKQKKKNLPKTDDAVVQKKTDESYQKFKEILEYHYKTEPVFPTEGTLELFHFLKSQEIKIALTTGFYRKVTDIILDRLEWNSRLDENYLGNKESVIDFSVTSDQVEDGRPAPDMIFRAMKMLNIDNPKQVIKIGDTPSDLQAGKNADCLLSLGITNGTHTKKQLEKVENDGLFENLNEFKMYLELKL